MPNISKLPPMNEIREKVALGWTHQKIAEWASEIMGVPISRSTVSVALHRLGETRRIRYSRELPWKVKDEHARKYHAGMLRLQARLDRGQELGDSDLRRLTAWRNSLMRDDAVIHYEPNTDIGWWKIKRRPGIDTWWIREPEVEEHSRGSRNKMDRKRKK